MADRETILAQSFISVVDKILFIFPETPPPLMKAWSGLKFFLQCSPLDIIIIKNLSKTFLSESRQRLITSSSRSTDSQSVSPSRRFSKEIAIPEGFEAKLDRTLANNNAGANEHQENLLMKDVKLMEFLSSQPKKPLGAKTQKLLDLIDQKVKRGVTKKPSNEQSNTSTVKSPGSSEKLSEKSTAVEKCLSNLEPLSSNPNKKANEMLRSPVHGDEVDSKVVQLMASSEERTETFLTQGSMEDDIGKENSRKTPQRHMKTNSADLCISSKHKGSNSLGSTPLGKSENNPHVNFMQNEKVLSEISPQHTKTEKGSHFQRSIYTNLTETFDTRASENTDENDLTHNAFLEKLRQYKQLDWKANGLLENCEDLRREQYSNKEKTNEKEKSQTEIVKPFETSKLKMYIDDFKEKFKKNTEIIERMRYHIREIETPMNLNLGSRKHFFEERDLKKQSNVTETSILKNYSFYSKQKGIAAVELSFLKTKAANGGEIKRKDIL